MVDEGLPPALVYRPLMAIVPDFSQLDAMTEAELIQNYDQLVKGNQIRGGTEFWLDEIARRRAERAERRMWWLTVAIFILTVGNLVLVAVSTL